jgi:hypothetical protein
MSCGVGARATSDRKPNWCLRAVLLQKEKQSPCSDLPLLQRSVVEGIEPIRALVLEETAAIRKKLIVRISDADEGQDA